jgi:hypothetical protein
LAGPGGKFKYHQGEIIELKDRDGNLIDYSDTRQTMRMRRELAGLNDTLAGIEIGVPAAERRGLHLVVTDYGANKVSYVLPTPGNGLVRKFSRGSFNLHGRVYGWWQNLPKWARSSMTINGAPVAEVDYSALHLTMLYNQAGIKFAGDPYNIAGYQRYEVKLAVNTSFNARTKRVAVAALADNLGASRERAAKVIDAIQSHHKPIAGCFCSDAGIKLMYKDSSIILAALGAANDDGIPALPVHDSMIVPVRSLDRTHHRRCL